MSAHAAFFLLLLDESDILLTLKNYTNKTVFHAAAEEESLPMLSVLLNLNLLFVNVQNNKLLCHSSTNHTCLSFESAVLSFLLSDASVVVNMEDSN